MDLRNCLNMKSNLKKTLFKSGFDNILKLKSLAVIGQTHWISGCTILVTHISKESI